MIKVQRKIEYKYPLIFLSIAGLLLLEIPLKSAIILVYVLAVIAVAGEKITTKVGYNDVGVGIGSVVGVGVFTFGIQLLLLLDTPSALAHWSVIAALIQSKLTITYQTTLHDLNRMPCTHAIIKTKLTL